jgi:hypothetical protein
LELPRVPLRLNRPAVPTRLRPRRPEQPVLVPALQTAGEAAATLLQKSLHASHDALVRLEDRRRSKPGDADEAISPRYQKMLLREAMHRKLPDLAMYATSVLLACVIGTSIALYLR